MIDLHDGVASLFAEANSPRAPRDEDEVRHDNWGAHFLSLRGEDDLNRRWEKTLRVSYKITPIAPVRLMRCPRCRGPVEVRPGSLIAICFTRACGTIGLSTSPKAVKLREWRARRREKT
jgi:hypothetical protein